MCWGWRYDRSKFNTDAPFMRVDMISLTLYKRVFISPMNGEEIKDDKYFLISLARCLFVGQR